ncbi:elongator complex protein 3 [Patescibacteria group bacterium]
MYEKILKKLVRSKIESPDDLASFKRKMAKKYEISCPSNILLLQEYYKLVKKRKIAFSERIKNLLCTRPVRSLSGIVNVSVLTKPYPCPGKCLYCPTEKGIPKSYVSGEPAVERAKKLKYNPYLQTKQRIKMLTAEGHPTDKIELRIVGGTWSYYPKKYQNWFIKKCFDSCNNKTSKNLTEAQKLNEIAKNRIIGLSVETRPDFVNEDEVAQLRKFGVTMVELGVQSIFNDVLKINLRGHGKEETISATKLLKDAGFKVLYQMMPNLPGSTIKKDEKMFKELFENPNFQPDLLKIYPCALLREAPLYSFWKAKKYRPYSRKELIGLIKFIKKEVPYYVRIQRITRDIPSVSIVSGPAKISNLRQFLAEISKKEGWDCKCIRCREVGKKYEKTEKIKMFRKNYGASSGKEIFLSFENKKRNKLYSLLRLRITKTPSLPILKDSTIIREIHTFGQLVSINKKGGSPQHTGLGQKLLKEAEKISKKEFKIKKIAVISGIGARNYFRKLGYSLKNNYMVKEI